MPPGRPCKFGRQDNGKCNPNPNKTIKVSTEKKVGKKNTRKSPIKGEWEIMRIDYVVPTISREDSWNVANKQGHYAISNIQIKVSGTGDGKDHIIEFDLTDKPIQVYIDNEEEKSPLKNKIKTRKWPAITKMNLGSDNVKFVMNENDDDDNYSTEVNIRAIKSGSDGKHFTGLKSDEDEKTVLEDAKKFIIASAKTTK